MTAVPPLLLPGLSRVVQAAGLAASAYALGFLQTRGILLYLGAGIGTEQLALAALAAAWLFFLGASWSLVGWLSGLFVGWRRRATGLLSGAAACTWLLFLAGYGLLALLGTESGYRKLSAPEGGHTLLIENRTFLLIGSHAVYEQLHGPIYAYRDSVHTDDGYDPFGGGAFSVQWGQDSATLSFAPSEAGEEGNAGDRTGRAVIPLLPR